MISQNEGFTLVSKVPSNSTIYEAYLDPPSCKFYSIQNDSLRSVQDTNRDPEFFFENDAQSKQRDVHMNVLSSKSSQKHVFETYTLTQKNLLQMIKVVMPQKSLSQLLNLTIRDSKQQKICFSLQFLQNIDLPLLMNLSLDTSFTQIRTLRKVNFKNLIKLQIAVQKIDCQQLSELHAPFLNQFSIHTPSRHFLNVWAIETDRVETNLQVLFKMETQFLHYEGDDEQDSSLVDKLVKPYIQTGKIGKLNQFMQRHPNFNATAFLV